MSQVMQAMMNPRVMSVMMEVQQNPAAAAKYQNDPELSELFTMFQEVMSS